MAPRGKTVKIGQTKKTSKRRPRAASTCDNHSDTEFNIEGSPEAVVTKRRRGRRTSLSKTTSSCVAKPSIKVIRSTTMVIPAVVRPEAEVPEEVPYWQRRRTLNPNTPYEEPTAKQVTAAAADWSEGQHEPRFPEFDLYGVVIQDPTDDDVIITLNTEPRKRMGDLQFLLQIRYEGPIDEARDYHEALFLFKYDMPPDTERQYLRSAAVKNGQIRVARVWGLSEVKGRQGAWEKCRADEGMFLSLVVGRAGLAKVSLEQWREEMERRQSRPRHPDPEAINLDDRRPPHSPRLAVAEINSGAVGGICLPSMG